MTASGQAEGGKAPLDPPPSGVVGRRVASPHSTEVSFVLVGRNRGVDAQLQVLTYLGELEDPERVFESRRSSYTDVHWERLTETYERVTLDDVKRERK